MDAFCTLKYLIIICIQSVFSFMSWQGDLSFIVCVPLVSRRSDMLILYILLNYLNSQQCWAHFLHQIKSWKQQQQQQNKHKNSLTWQVWRQLRENIPCCFSIQEKKERKYRLQIVQTYIYIYEEQMKGPAWKALKGLRYGAINVLTRLLCTHGEPKRTTIINVIK